MPRGAGGSSHVSRRAFLRTAGGAALGLAAAGAAPVRPSNGTGRQSVAVLGGGIAGLAAAHELAIRGFEVTVHEARAWGGKARSTLVPDTASDGRGALPGEHGYRVEFGFYQNLPDMLRRIPDGSNPNGTFDNLVEVSHAVWSREGRRDLTVPLHLTQPAHTPSQVIDLMLGLLLETNLPPEALAAFGQRVAVYMSSSNLRRYGQWEQTSWSDFIRADQYSEDYRKLLGETFTQYIQASKLEGTSAHFSGRVLELFVYALMGRGSNGALLRIFDAPTNEAWIDPWVRQLKRLGVDLRLGSAVTKLHVRDGRVVGVTTTGSSPGVTVADWYVCALPVERAVALWDTGVLRADPALATMADIPIGWMNGLQFYMREPTPIASGHVICVDSPWLVSFISQGQFWERDFPSQYGDGSAADCLSAIISNWDRPGVLFGKPARECSEAELVAEVWAQMKRHVADDDPTVLRDDALHSWTVDPGIIWKNGRPSNEDPLPVPTLDTRRYRPTVDTGIPNLFLTGDYLKGDALVGNMEAAITNSRLAVNALLARSGSQESPTEVTGFYEPPEWEAAKRIDEERYRNGQPNLLDGPDGAAPSRADMLLLRQLGLDGLLTAGALQI